MDEQVFQLIMSKLTTVELKVDELISFKHYFIGISAAVASIVSIAIKFLIR